MVVKKEALEKIRQIIDKHHKYLLLTMIGQNNIPPEILKELKRQGIDPKDTKSFLELAYNHNFINVAGQADAPSSVPEMVSQQNKGFIPSAEANATSKDYLNANLTHLIEKHKAEVLSRIESLIHGENNQFKFDSMQKRDRHESIDQMLKEKSKGKIKQLLRDASKDASRNWERIVSTELSNTISLASADRIVAMNPDTPAGEIYVYRIVVNDAALCKYCRKFYMDSDGSPKVYRLSTILANGSNFGKRAIDWKPVAAATHPNERCSQLLELKPGWRVLSGGSQSFIGPEKWKTYIGFKLEG